MFRPNVKCKISKMQGFTGAGKRLYGPWSPAVCGVVYLMDESEQTSVRTDSSGSKAAARSEQIQGRILFPAAVILAAGDRVSFMDKFDMTVKTVFPRYAVTGKLDHWQVDLDIWKG